MRRYCPHEADTLLLDPNRIEHACNPYTNPAFLHADARTRDALGNRLVDYMGGGGVEAGVAWLTRAVHMSQAELEACLQQEPLKLSLVRKDGKKDRLVGVPTYRRRCLSNLVKGVLVSTVQHQLPRSVRAYLEDTPDAVNQAVLDVAEAVANGKLLYWAKLDFSSYFPSMTWPSIEAALRHYRCTERVIEIEMTMVRAPIVKVRRGKVITVPNTKGSQMGLAESSVLANMVPFDLDDHFEAISNRVFYLRYCDDILVGSPHHHEVVGAVRKVMKWARQNGLRLKGVSPNTRASTLVKDIRKNHIPFLGKEVDQNGYVHIPDDKFQEKIDEVRRRHALLAVDDVHGVSRYADGRGCDLFDDDDVRAVVQGTVRDWEPLDPKAADRFEEVTKLQFPLTSGQPGQGLVWHCLLGRPDGHGGGGHRPPCPSPQAPHQSPATPDHEPSASGAGHVGTGRPGSPGEDGGTHPLLGATDASEGTSRIPREGASRPWGEEREVATASSLGESPHDTREVILDSHGSGGRKTYRFHTPSPKGNNERAISLVVDEGSIGSFPGGGAEGEPGEDEPPVPPCFENERTIHIHTQWTRKDGLVLVGAADVDGAEYGTEVTVVPRSRPEVALVRAITAEVTRAKADGVRGMEVRLSESWLPKHLLQPERRFHAPRLFGAVLELHRVVKDSGMVVRVVGPVLPPEALVSAISRRSLPVRPFIPQSAP